MFLNPLTAYTPRILRPSSWGARPTYRSGAQESGGSKPPTRGLRCTRHRGMLLVASTAASRPLPLLARSGGRGAPPCIRTARPEALTVLQLRSSSSTLSCACSPSPSPAPSPSPEDGGKGSARHLFDVTSHWINSTFCCNPRKESFVLEM